MTHVTHNWKMHNVSNIFQGGGKLSPSTNEDMGLCTPPSKFGLKTNNMFLSHKDDVQNLGLCQGRALVSKTKLSIHPVCPTIYLTAGELKVDWHDKKQPILDSAPRNTPGINRRD
ncbi:hypothetical protein C1H46_023116 [Malus baccata]|uniref:Uncharacterized protein n=1 Tax=Malus baccata TaxID=106549 RepID=A0A540LXT8_MALBA|nr:hypothetical protein C1H46_023116 [Malus baccata]